MEEIVKRLERERDEDYAVFQQKLIPTLSPEKFIGVRTPALRRLARELWQEEALCADFLKELPHTFYDENQLHFFAICENRHFEECLAQVDAFLPYVDNWSTCDQPFPKVFEKHVTELRPHILRWLESGEPYTVRFGIGATMRLYLEKRGNRYFDRELMDKIEKIRSEEYYVNMMIAWYFATALAKQWETTVRVLEEGRLSPWVHNKTIQKARESFRINGAQKDVLEGLKIPKAGARCTPK